MNCYSKLLQDITVVFVNASQIICTPREHDTRWDPDTSCDIWESLSCLQGQAGRVFDTTDGGTILYLMAPMESLSKPPKWGRFLKLLPGVQYLLIPVAIPQLALKLSLCFCFTENCFGSFFTSQIICGNKMPTRCNRGFYCRSYCLLNMFRAPLCPSSGAQEYYTVVAMKTSVASSWHFISTYFHI